MVPGLKPPAYAKGYGKATEENVKKLVFSIIAVLLIAISAFAATEDETAVAKVLETFAAKAAERDSRGMANLFVEDGVMKYFYGTVNEPKIAEGRMKIYIVFSFGNVTGYKVEDIKVTKVDGDSAQATGRVIVRATAFGANFRRESEVAWRLKRVEGAWQISAYDFKLAPMIRE